MRHSTTKRIPGALRILVTGGVFILLQICVDAQVPVGAGSQLGEDYLRARGGKGTDNALRRAMIVSWVQGYIVGCARSLTEERVVPEIAARIERGELPPDVDLVLRDPHGQLLAMLQKKFGTRSGWVFDPPDAETVQAWLISYCQQHPSIRISDAAAALVDELDTRSKRKP